MTIVYQNQHATVRAGDCLDVLKAMPDESVHAVVTDPPYGLSNTTPEQVAECLKQWATGNTSYTPPKRGGFMGQAWDSFVPPPAVWAECLRVLKPGGHLVAFAGSRTQDLMGMSIRMAGFEIRDSVAWLYGAGFPKSLDVSKAIDKGSGQNRARQYEFTEWMRSTGITAKQIDEVTGTHMGGHYLTNQSQPAIATADLFDKLRPHLPPVPERIERLVAERTGIEWTDYVKRDVLSERPAFGIGGNGTYGGHAPGAVARETASHSADAQQWEGWGTALKPSHEPVVVARKPLIGTVAANVLEHGTGALNIDGCRIGLAAGESSPTGSGNDLGYHGRGTGTGGNTTPPTGRWPANVILDESQAAALDQQSGNRPSSGGAAFDRGGYGGTVGLNRNDRREIGYGDTGGASRFFYVSKASKKERPSYVPPVLRLRDDLTPEQADLVKARLQEAGIALD